MILDLKFNNKITKVKIGYYKYDMINDKPEHKFGNSFCLCHY